MRKKSLDRLFARFPSIKLLTDVNSINDTAIVEDIDGIIYNVTIATLKRKKYALLDICTAVSKFLAFKTKAKIIHNNKYFYNRAYLSNLHEYVYIECPIHGIFQQKAYVHLNGHGCPKCGGNIKYTFDSILQKFKDVHGDRYDYSLSTFTNSKDFIKIVCREHGIFTQKVKQHMLGQGCPECGKFLCGTWSREEWVRKFKNKVGTVYIIEFFNKDERFIKIGITTNTIKTRFSSSTKYPYEFIILKELKCSVGVAWDIEKHCLNIFKPYRYTPKLTFAGCTECFNIKNKKEIIDYDYTKFKEIKFS